MNKILCAAVVLISFIPSYSFASQNYIVSFTNKNYPLLNITPNGPAGKCFSDWNEPYGGKDLTNKIFDNKIRVRVTDKNSGNCINAEKKAAWTVTGDGFTTQIITLDHQRHNWTTQVTSSLFNTDESKNKSIIKSAKCQVSYNPDKFVDCYNILVSGVGDGNEIDIVF